MGFIHLHRGCACALVAFVLTFTASAHAAEEPLPDRAKLLGIAKQFVDKIGSGLKDADAMLAEYISPEDLRMQKYFDALEDGEVLVMQINLQSTKKSEYRKLNLEQPVIGIKEGKDVLVSLLDFVSAANFAIKVTPEKGQAKGWFIREYNTFDLDLGQVTLNIAGQPVDLDPGDVEFGDEDIMVRGKALAKWFGFQILVNPRSQQIQVVTAQKWPIQEQIDRAKRFNTKRRDSKPQQPLIKTEHKLAQFPNANVALRQEYRKLPTGNAISSTSYNIQSKGDLAGHLATLTATGTNENSIESVFLNFKKESDSPVLLGPLKARIYEFNDVLPTSVPLAGSAPTERGARVTNKAAYGTLDTTIVIDGYAPPGWDVELYRGPQYITGVNVDETGRYSFENIVLFAGENKFRVIQYGPQGEYREEERTIAATSSLHARDHGVYDVSLTQQGQHTYETDPQNDDDRNTPHLSATYERQVHPNLALRGGIRARQQRGNQIAYLHGGTVSVWNEAIINADAILTTDATYMGSLTARKNFGPNTFYGATTYRSGGFVTNTGESPQVPSQIDATAQMRGPFRFYGFKKAFAGTYDSFAAAFRRSNGNTGFSTGLTLSSGTRKLNFSNALTYSYETSGFSGIDDRNELDGTLSLRGRAFDTTWRTNFGYEVMPDMRFTNLNLNLNKTLTKEIEAEFDLRRDIDTRYMIETASLNWRTPYATITPGVSYDSDEVMVARMNVRFGLSYDPYTNDFVMEGKNLAERGGISAFVFLDKEGDGKFTEGDEPLQDVTVEAVQSGREALSDADGEAFLYDLPTNRVTDIVMEENSTFDPNWVSAFKGISMRPRPGEKMHLEFPVQRGSEMDGTAYIEDEDGKRVEARNITFNMTTPEGKVVRAGEAPYDGFFVIGRIPPGVYYMVADAEFSPTTAFMLPKKYVFTSEGAVLYGQDQTLYKGYDIPFTFASTNKAPTGERGTRVIRPTDIGPQETFLKIGKYKSRLAMGLDWYKFRLRSKWGSHFTLETPLSDIPVDENTMEMTITLKPKAALSMEQAADVCADLIDAGFTCGVHTVTTYNDPSKVTEETPAKKEESQKT